MTAINENVAVLCFSATIDLCRIVGWLMEFWQEVNWVIRMVHICQTVSLLDAIISNNDSKENENKIRLKKWIIDPNWLTQILKIL